MKLFAFGLDGASYRLINEFIKKDIMPNFKRITEQGYLRELQATTPPHTAPGWTSAFTGLALGNMGSINFGTHKRQAISGNSPEEMTLGCYRFGIY